MSTLSTTEIASPIRLGFDAAGILLTPEEFDEISEYDDLYRYELINGVLVVNPIPSEAEADPNEILGYLFNAYKRNHPQGSILDKTLPERYVPTQGSRRRADRVVWVGLGRRPNPKFDIPTIVIEFVSRGKRNRRRDYETKRDEYLAVGVVEYWVVDRFARKMTVFRQCDRGPVERTVGADEIYTTDLLPGFELPLREILQVADEWEDEE